MTTTCTRRWRPAAAALALAAASSAQAGPMGFKDSWMAMGDAGPDWRETWVNHAFTARDAFGAGALWMRSHDGSRRRELGELTYTRLLQRWNLPHAQANIWFVTGLGAVRGNDFAGSRALWSPGLQLDFETTRLYLAASGRLFRARDLKHDYASVRAGFSFYEADYDQTQPWLIVEARRMRDLSAKTEITPLLRLIHQRYFVELGLGTEGQARFNFMYIF